MSTSSERLERILDEIEVANEALRDKLPILHLCDAIKLLVRHVAQIEEELRREIESR